MQWCNSANNDAEVVMCEVCHVAVKISHDLVRKGCDNRLAFWHFVLENPGIASQMAPKTLNF